MGRTKVIPGKSCQLQTLGYNRQGECSRQWVWFVSRNPSTTQTLHPSNEDEIHFLQGMKHHWDGTGQSHPPAAQARDHEFSTCLSHCHAMVQQHKGRAGGELANPTSFVLFSWLSSLHLVLDDQFSRTLIYSSFFTLSFPA